MAENQVTQMYSVAVFNWLRERDGFKTKAVMATDWRNALEKTFPEYVEYVKDAESLEVAQEIAVNLGWEFTVNVLEGVSFGPPVPIVTVDVKKEQPFSSLTEEERLSLPEKG